MKTENNDFNQLVLNKLESIEKTLKELVSREDKLNGKDLLDNQDLCLLLKVSKRTLQRYRKRESNSLTYYKIGQKTFYLMSDVKEFLRINFNKDVF